MNVPHSRLLSVAIAGLLAGVTAVPAFADAQLEEVTVTARRRAENLQAVPLSMTALSEEDIQRRSIRDMKDLAQATPGVTFFDANPVLATPVIRGLSQTVISAPDRNVGLFYNGVFLSNMNASDFNLFDMERIEVVKGPVSALYGHNAFAGAINYVPKQASIGGAPDGFMEATFGSDARAGGRLAVNVPVSDTLALRLGGGYDTWDGAFPNSAAGGGHVGGYSTTNFVWDVRWKPMEQLSVGQFGFYVNDQREATAQLSFPNNCGQVSGSGTSAANPPRPSFYCGELIGTKSIAIPKPGYGTKRQGVVTGLNVDYDFGPVTASIIGGYANLEATYLVDLDLTTDPRGRPYYMYAAKNGPLSGQQPVGTQYFHSFAGTGPDTTRDMTWEVRLASKQNERFRWMLGASHYDHYMQRTNGVGVDSTGYTGNLFPWSSYVNTFNAFKPVTDVGSLVTIAKNHIDDSSPAVYASLAYDVTDKFTASADVRHDEENRKLTNDLTGVVQKRTDKYETYRFSLDYRFNPDAMVYASAAKGVIAGFFNGTSDPFVGLPIPVELQNYKPSTNWTYEIGTKTSWLDHRLVANLAVFYIEYSDLQITATPPPPLFATLITNAAAATAKGFEISLDGRITDSLIAGIGYGYTDPRYSSGTKDLGVVRFCGVGTPPLCTTDVSGNMLTRASQHTVNGYVEYASTLATDWNWFARLDGRYQSKQYPRSLDLQWYPGYEIFNARLGFSKGGKYDVELWVKNLFDKYYISNAIAQPLTNPSPVQLSGSTDFFPNTMMGEPRSYGVTARYRF